MTRGRPAEYVELRSDSAGTWRWTYHAPDVVLPGAERCADLQEAVQAARTAYPDIPLLRSEASGGGIGGREGPGTSLVRSVAVARLASSLVLLARPVGVLDLVQPGSLPPLSAAGARLLGARRLVQALAVLRRPRPAVLRAGAAVDSLHLLSMLGLAVLSRRYRRLALVAGAMAALDAWVDLTAARRVSSEP